MEKTSHTSWTTDRLSRRSVLVAAGAALTGLGGCTGLVGSSDDEAADGPEPPWTTAELAEQAEAEESGKVVVYAGTGDFAPWEQIGEIITEEYSWFEIDGIAGKGGEISQRVLQEHQAGQAEVDIISQGDEIYTDDDLRDDLIVSTHDENYWFSEGGDVSEYASQWFASPLNGGPSVAIGLNPAELDRRGLDTPESWNDLLDDQYEDVPVIFPQEPNLKRFGWIVSYHAEEMGMEPNEWLQAQKDHLDLRIVSSHTPGARFLGEGRAPLMHHNYPWVLRRFVEDLNVQVYFPDPVPMFLSSGIVSEYTDASHPWTARFFISVMMEEWVQEEIAQSVEQFGPGRLDVDYSGLGLDEYTARTLDTSVDLIGFQGEAEYKQLADDVYKEVLGQPGSDLG